MGTKLNADEILEMASRIESKGAKFYRKAAKLHLAAREFLLQIAEQEDLHFKTFEEMRRSLAPNEKEGGRDPYGETDLYLHAMVDGYAFDINEDPESLLTGRESMDDILKMAIGMEKDSIVFYLGLKQIVPPAMGRDRIDAIVKEEMQHIVWLSGKRAELK
ncbi:MAG TPA: ferritin family protein [Kiritimatiellia bacterium]|nr:ferritin family protein [Kiritimatiellia bacterium]